MEEWNPFKISPMDKEILDIFIKYGYGYLKSTIAHIFVVTYQMKQHV